MMDINQTKRWKFIHRRAGGTFVSQINRLFDWDSSRAENEKGSFKMTLPADYLFDFMADDIIEFWRSWDNGRSFHLVDETCWFVRDAEYAWDGGKEVISLTGHDTIGLLDRRVVAWFATTTTVEGQNTYSRKTGPAGNAIYSLFNENFGAGVVGVVSTDVPPSAGGPVGGASAIAAVPSDRRMTLISYAPGPDIGPVINLECAWKNVLSSMKDVTNQSAQAGTKLFFDILYNPDGSPPFTFKVFADIRGIDRTIGGRAVVFSLEHENVSKMTLKRQFSDEITWTHIGGAGQGPLRLVQGDIAELPAFKRSPFYPIESFVENTKTSDFSTLKSSGDAELYKHRARYLFSAETKDSPWTVYGRDYGYGDLVLAKHRGIVGTCRVSKTRISVKGGQETLSIPLDSNDDLASESAN